MRISLDGGITITGSISLNRFIQEPFTVTYDTSLITSTPKTAYIYITFYSSLIPPDAVLDWGDGNISFVNYSGWYEHDYSSTPDTYQITIEGYAPIVEFISEPGLVSIDNFGNISLWQNRNANCVNLTNVAPSLPGTVRSCMEMFWNCSNINDTNIGYWNMSNVESINSMFESCTSFNVNLASWNTSNVVSAHQAFKGATAFNNNISTWNTANISNITEMFDGATSFNQNLNNWNVSNVTSLVRTFANSGFNGNIRDWNTARVSNLQQTFFNATSFNQDLFWNTSNVINVNNTFANCSNFDGNIASWDTSNVTTFAYAFSNAGNFTSNLYSWNTISCSNFVGMFNNALAYNNDLGNWYTDRHPGDTEPTDFATNVVGWTLPKPPWTAGGMFIDYSPASASQLISFTTTGATGWVDWGDGNSENFTSSLSHTYATSGNKTIQIKGAVSNFDTGTTSRNQYIYSIDSFGNIGLTNVYLGNCSNLTSVPDYLPYTVRTFRFGYLTGTCPINDANIVSWDVSNVTNMGNMFFNCTSFNQPIGSWDTGKVLSMERMFEGATVFNADISNWSVSNVGSFSNTFSYAAAFNQDIGNWQVGGAGNMSFMFEHATSFNQDLSDWCVINFDSAPANFSHNTPSWVQPQPSWGTCSIIPANAMIVQYTSSSTGNTRVAAFDGYTDVELTLLSGETFLINESDANFANVSKSYIESSRKTFYVTGNSDSMICGNRTIRVKQWGDIELRNFRANSSAFIEIPDTLPATFNNAYRMMADATNFTDANVANWNVSNITNMSYMFEDADIDSFLDLSGWNVSKVTDMSGMFYNCALFNSDITMWNTSNVTDMSEMFRGATIFNQPIGNWDTSKVANMSNMFAFTKNFQQDINDWNVANVTDFSYMFRASANSTSPTIDDGFTSNLANWNTSNATNMEGMFYQANNFSGNIETWNTSKVTNMSNMFGYARRAPLVLDGWDVSNVTDMSRMFYDNSPGTASLDIGNWNVSNVTDFSQMFFGCPDFNSNIANWNTSSAQEMDGMFELATSFNQPIGNWETGNVTLMTSMFFGATSFNQSLKYWDVSNVDANYGMWYMFENATSFNQDLSRWCVSHIASEPTDFATGAVAWTEPKPIWGTCPQPDMYLTYTFITSSSIDIVMEGNVDTIVYWGDGNQDTYNSNTTATHTYASAGSYTVTIEGTTEKLQAESEYLTGVTSFGNLGIIDLSYAFANSPNLSVVANNFPTTVTNLTSTFSGSGSINDSNIALWDTGNVTDMTALFNNATVFNQDLSVWCVTNIVAEPTDFATGSSLILANYPVWGTCP